MWTILDSVIVLVYLAVLMAIGFYYKDRIENLDDYLVAGRSKSWVTGMMSIFASFGSVFMFTGAIGMAYYSGMGIMWYFFGVALGYSIMAWIAPRIRATRSTTVFNWVKDRFGKSTHILFLIIGSLMGITAGGMYFYACAIVPTAFLGWPMWYTIVLLAGLAIFYTTLSGMHGVMMSDLIQGTIMFSVLIFAVLIGLSNIGGFSGLTANIEPEYFHLINPHSGLGSSMGLFIGLTLGSMYDFGYVGHRVLSVDTPSDAKKALIGSGLIYLVFGFFVLIGGLLTRIAFPEVENVSHSFMIYLKSILPTGVLGLFLVAAFAAAMSSADSYAHNLCGWVVQDFYHGYINPEQSQKNLVKYSRLALIGFFLLFIATSSLVPLLGGVFDFVAAWTLAPGIMMTTVLFVGTIWDKLSERVATLSVLIGVVVFVVYKVFSLGPAYLVNPLSGFTCLGIQIIGGLLFPPSGAEKKKIGRWFDTLMKNKKEDEEAGRNIK